MTSESRQTRKKVFAALAVGFFVLVVVVLTLRAAGRINQPGVRYPEVDPDAWALRDFRDAIYYPARAMLDGVSPYHAAEYLESYPVGQDFPFYSPLTLLIHLPFAILPFSLSQWVYFGVTIGLTVVLAQVLLMVCRLPRSVGSVFGLAGLILLTRPGHMNLLLGQTTVPLVLCTLLALHLARQRPWAAGMFLAIATFKPTYGVVLLALMGALGHWRAVWAGLTMSAVITLPLVVWVVSMQGGWAESLRILQENGQLVYENPGRDPAHSFSRIDVLALWARVAQTAPSQTIELAATGLFIVMSCLAIFLRRRGRVIPAATEPVALLAVSALLIGVYHHAYDALLLVPAVLMAGLKLDDFWRGWPAGQRWIWCGLIAIPLANYAATNSVISAWEVSGPAWIGLTSVNGIAVLVATIWLAIELWRERGTRIPDSMDGRTWLHDPIQD